MTWSTSRIRRRRTTQPDRATRCRRPGRGRGSGCGPRRAGRRPGAQRGRPAATTGAPRSDGDDARRRRGRARAPARGSSGVGRRGARGRPGRCRPARTCRGPRGRPARRPARGAGGTREELPCWRRSRPVTIADSRAPRASRSADRLGEVDAGDPLVVERGLAGREQAAGQVPGRRRRGSRVSRNPQFVTTYPPIDEHRDHAPGRRAPAAGPGRPGERRAVDVVSGSNRSQKPADLEQLGWRHRARRPR